MTINPEASPNAAAIESVPGSSEKNKKPLLPGFVIIIIAVLALIIMSAASHPYTGSGVVKSHTPLGSASCLITVIESNGTEHLYQKIGGLPFCQGVEDGAKAEVKNGVIDSITSR